MKKYSCIILVLALQISCSRSDKAASRANADSSEILARDQRNGLIAIDTLSILKDFDSWYYYHKTKIKLGQKFISLNRESLPISKEEFLRTIIAGNRIPFWIKVDGGIPVYKLFKYDNLKEDVKSTVRQTAQEELDNMAMEGTVFPADDLVDLNGVSYGKNNTQGKTIIVKCWFIACVACVKEFPVLNELVAEYRNKHSILFVSLAMDSGQQLKKFLKRKPFSYVVIPDKEELMTKKLKIRAYPTHLVVDTTGTIKKVFSNAEDLVVYLKSNTREY